MTHMTGHGPLLFEAVAGTIALRPRHIERTLILCLMGITPGERGKADDRCVSSSGLRRAAGHGVRG
jgi:hypothetical protein